MAEVIGEGGGGDIKVALEEKFPGGRGGGVAGVGEGAERAERGEEGREESVEEGVI